MQIDSASPLIPAAAKLLAIIRGKNGKGTLTDFADAHGLDRYKLQKVIHGDVRRVDVDFAFACQRATKGAVKAEEFVPDEELLKKLKGPTKKRAARSRVESG